MIIGNACPVRPTEVEGWSSGLVILGPMTFAFWLSFFLLDRPHPLHLKMTQERLVSLKSSRPVKPLLEEDSSPRSLLRMLAALRSRRSS